MIPLKNLDGMNTFSRRHWKEQPMDGGDDTISL